MSDLIERKKAIDATWEEPSYTDPINVLTEVRDRIKRLPSAQPLVIHCTDCEGWHERQSILGFAISELPPVQPEIEERTEESAQIVPKEDLISRKAAIDALGERPMVWTDDDQYALGERNQYDIDRLAIETLPSVQPEPCEDAVSRDSVKFLLCEETCHPGAFCPDGFCKEICEKVDALPSATPKQRMGEWIPVSERLPESKYEDLEYPTVIVCCGDGAVTLACYYESTKEWGTGEYYDRIINPVAWMPLPEPYRAERRTDEGD